MKQHPLFCMDLDPTNIEDDAIKAQVDVGSFYVYKIIPGRSTPILWSPRIDAHEIQTPEQFVARFGGGHWELKGRGIDDKCVVRIVRFECAGPDKDASGNLVNPPGGPGMTGVQPSNGIAPGLEFLLQRLAPQPAPAPAHDTIGTLQIIAAIAAAVAPVLVASVQAKEESSRAIMAMIGQMGSNAATGQVQLIQALTGKSPGTETGVALTQSFIQGFQAMGDLVKKGKEGEGGPDVLDAIGTIVQNLTQLIGKGADAIKFVNGGGVDVAPEPEVPQTSA